MARRAMMQVVNLPTAAACVPPVIAWAVRGGEFGRREAHPGRLIIIGSGGRNWFGGT